MTIERSFCPCCGYPTLSKRIDPRMPEWDICVLCKWEDDGQTDIDADRVRGGPNGKYSLTQARENYNKYLVMYSPDNDTRIMPGNWPGELETKQLLVKRFEELKTADDESIKQSLWQEILKLEDQLDNITSEKVREYEARLKR